MARFAEVLGWVLGCVGGGVDVKMGGGDYLKGVQLSPLDELSGELSGGSSGRVVAELSN